MTKYEFISMSLPYGLKVLRKDNKTVLRIVGIDPVNIFFYENMRYTYGSLIECNIILRPLSDLTKEKINNGVSYYDYIWHEIVCSDSDSYDYYELLESIMCIESAPFAIIQYLVKNHFDIANLIESGEAIDVNQLQINPYK